jgi:hypothetical protein
MLDLVVCDMLQHQRENGVGVFVRHRLTRITTTQRTKLQISRTHLRSLFVPVFAIIRQFIAESKIDNSIGINHLFSTTMLTQQQTPGEPICVPKHRRQQPSSKHDPLDSKWSASTTRQSCYRDP